MGLPCKQDHAGSIPVSGPSKLAVVAHLGERHLVTVEATGSKPVDGANNTSGDVAEMDNAPACKAGDLGS